MLIYIGSKFCDDLIINIISSYWSELEIPCGEHIGPKTWHGVKGGLSLYISCGNSCDYTRYFWYHKNRTIILNPNSHSAVTLPVQPTRQISKLEYKLILLYSDLVYKSTIIKRQRWRQREMLYIYPIGNEISIYVQNTTTIINAKQEIITCSYKYIFYQSMKQKKSM